MNKCDCCGGTYEDDIYTYHSTFGGVLCILCESEHLYNTTDKIQLVKIAGKGKCPLVINVLDVTVENIQWMKKCKEQLTKIHSCTYIINYIELRNEQTSKIK